MVETRQPISDIFSQGGFDVKSLAVLLDKFREPFQIVAFAPAATLVGGECARFLKASIDQDRVVGFFHILQFGLPQSAVRLDALDPDLTL